MNIVIAMMCCHGQPCERNRDAFIEYVYRDYQNLKKEGKLKHNYRFIFYRGQTEEDRKKHQAFEPASVPPYLPYSKLSDENGNDLLDEVKQVKTTDKGKDLLFMDVPVSDGIEFTYEKTISAFYSIRKYFPDFDCLVRINISAFLNIRLLDKVIETTDPETIYCNAINAVLTDSNYANALYPRGDFYIMSRQYIDKILFSDYKCSKLSNKTIHPYELYYIWDSVSPIEQKEQIFGNRLDHVDDVLMGCTIKDVVGPNYFNKVKMVYYNLMIHPVEENSDLSEYLNRHVLTVRCKTVPPGQVSGWSWADSDYRKCDVIKFRKCYEYFSRQSYENGLTMNHLLVNEKTARPVMTVDYKNITIAEAKSWAGSDTAIIGVR